MPDENVTPNEQPKTGVVTLGTKEYEELMKARVEAEPTRTETEQLRKAWESTQKVLRADTDEPTRERAMRQLMAQVGYSPEQIEDYFTPDDSPEGEKEEPVEPPSRNKKSSKTVEAPDNSELESIKAELEALKNQSNQNQIKRLSERLDAAIVSSLGGQEDINKILSNVQKKKGEDAAKSRRELFKKEVETEAKQALLTRRTREGRFDEGWVDEETRKAAEAVAAKYRSVIETADLIGRGSDTDSDNELFLKSKPVPPPSYKPGMQVTDAQAALRSFTEDLLKRESLQAKQSDGSSV